MLSYAPPHVEPGRLDARVAEFYRKLEAATAPPPAPPVHAAASSSGGGRGREGRGGSRDRGERAREGERGRDGGWTGDDRDRDLRYTAPASAPAHDGYGDRDRDRRGGHDGSEPYQRQGGAYAGRRGRDVTAPAGGGPAPAPALAPAPLGGGGGGGGGGRGEMDFAAYRQQLSSGYHQKILERG